MSAKAARNARIVELRKAGVWPAEIAQLLGMTRNAVLCFCRRNGLCDPQVNRRAVARTFARRGGGIGTSKLTEADVIAIRQTHTGRGAHSLGALAQRYGVSETAIYHVVEGRSWAHVVVPKRLDARQRAIVAELADSTWRAVAARHGVSMSSLSSWRRLAAEIDAAQGGVLR